MLSNSFSFFSIFSIFLIFFYNSFLLNNIEDASSSGVLILVIFKDFNNLYTSLKFSVPGPCNIFAPHFCFQRICPPFLLIDLPIKTEQLIL